MEIIPAVDILGGRCVRLLRGDYTKRTLYGDDPVAVARSWEDQGARRLHIVDLDGAKTGRMVNWKTIRNILGETTCRVEIGGGIRDVRTAEKLVDAGADRVIVGTAAFTQPRRFRAMMEKFTRRLWLSLDVRGSGLMLRGWTSAAGVTLGRFLRDAEGWPVGGMVLTSILKDGALRGPDLAMARRALTASRQPFILSGGISSLAHIRAIGRMQMANISGLIIGKALYEKKFTLKQAMGASG